MAIESMADALREMAELKKDVSKKLADAPALITDIHDARNAGELKAYRVCLLAIAEGIRADRRKIEAEYYNSSMTKKRQEVGGLKKMAENTDFYMRANEHIRDTYFPTEEQLAEILKEG